MKMSACTSKIIVAQHRDLLGNLYVTTMAPVSHQALAAERPGSTPTRREVPDRAAQIVGPRKRTIGTLDTALDPPATELRTREGGGAMAPSPTGARRNARAAQLPSHRAVRRKGQGGRCRPARNAGLAKRTGESNPRTAVERGAA